MSSDPGSPQVAARAGARPTAELAARTPASARAHSLGVRQMFDRISPTYDRLNHLLSFGIDRRWRARALEVLAQAVPAGGTWLDSCAGTLDLSEAIQTRWPEQPLLVGDFAREMLLAGRAKLRAPARAVVCDAMKLPFPDGRLTALTCAFGVRNLPDQERAVAEAQRVLAPGGVFLVLEFFRPTRLVSQVFHAIYGRTVLPLVGRIVSGDGEAYSYLSRSMRGYLTRGEYAQLMQRAGFRQVRSEDLTFGIASIVWGVK